MKHKAAVEGQAEIFTRTKAEIPLSQSQRMLAGLYRSRRKVATGAALVLAVMMGYHVVFGRNGVTVYEAKRRESVALEQQTLQLKEENARLKAHNERLKGDPAVIAHEARDRFGYTKPGEVIYTMPAAKAAGK